MPENDKKMLTTPFLRGIIAQSCSVLYKHSSNRPYPYPKLSKGAILTMDNKLASSTKKVRMNVKETAEFLEAHPETIRNWARQGKLPAHRIGKLGYYFFYQDELEQTLGIESPM